MHIAEVLHSLSLSLHLYDCSLCDTLYTYIRIHMDCISWNSLPSLPSQNVFALVIYCCISSYPQIQQLKTNKQTKNITFTQVLKIRYPGGAYLVGRDSGYLMRQQSTYQQEPESSERLTRAGGCTSKLAHSHGFGMSGGCSLLSWFECPHSWLPLSR